MIKAEDLPLKVSTDRTRPADCRMRLNLAAIPWHILKHLKWVQSNLRVQQGLLSVSAR